MAIAQPRRSPTFPDAIARLVLAKACNRVAETDELVLVAENTIVAIGVINPKSNHMVGWQCTRPCYALSGGLSFLFLLLIILHAGRGGLPAASPSGGGSSRGRTSGSGKATSLALAPPRRLVPGCLVNTTKRRCLRQHRRRRQRRRCRRCQAFASIVFSTSVCREVLSYAVADAAAAAAIATASAPPSRHRSICGRRCQSCQSWCCR